MSLVRAGHRAPLVLLVGFVALAVTACSGGGDTKAVKTAAPEAAPSTCRGRRAASRPPATPRARRPRPATRSVATVRRYVIAATIDPLHGKPVGNLTPLFTPRGRRPPGPRPRGRARRRCPQGHHLVKVTTAPLLMTALSDPNGAINLVGTSLYLDAKTTPRRGRSRSSAVVSSSSPAMQAPGRSPASGCPPTGAAPESCGPPPELDDHEHHHDRRAAAAPVLTATLLAPLVVALALAGLFAAVAPRRAAPVRVRGAVVPADEDGERRPQSCDKPAFIFALGNTADPATRRPAGDAIHVIGVNPI